MINFLAFFRSVCCLNRKARALLRVNAGEPAEVFPVLPPLSPIGKPMSVLEGFKEDAREEEPILRLPQEDRRRMGIKKGSYIYVRHQEHKIPVRVDVAASGDSGKDACRLNPVARTLLDVSIGDRVEILPSETLLLLFDISGSMNDSLGWGRSKLKATQNAIAKLLENKSKESENDQVGVIAFETDTHLVSKPTVNYDAVLERVKGLYAEGNTALYEGLEYSMKILRDAVGLRRILLLTDGVPTTTSSEKVLDLAKTARASAIVIDTVGVGGTGKKIRYDESLLREIAELTGGRFIPVDDVKSLEEGFLTLGGEKKIPLLTR